MTALGPRLRHRVTFEEQENTRDGEGRLTVEWVDAVLETGEVMADVPAEVLTGPGRESRQSDQLQTQVAARITCRYFAGLKGSWRIVWGEEIYNIETWELDKTGQREIRIRCSSGVNDGG